MRSATFKTRRIGGWRVWRAAAWVLGILFATATSASEPEEIGRRGTVRLGYWIGEVPFSDLGRDGKPVGYSVELCTRIADKLGAALAKPLRAEWVEIDATTRFTHLDQDRIDLACADITNTRSRQEKYAFSHSIFVAGTRMIAKTSEAAREWIDLRGKPVAVVGNTTGEALVKGLDQTLALSLKITVAPTLKDAWDLLERDQVVAVGYDDILLSGLAAKSSRGADGFHFVDGYLSVEPYGLMMRKQDTQLRKAVNDALVSIYESHEIGAIYDKWFMNADRRVPMSMHLREDIQTPNSYPAFP